MTTSPGQGHQPKGGHGCECQGFDVAGFLLALTKESERCGDQRFKIYATYYIMTQILLHE